MGIRQRVLLPESDMVIHSRPGRVWMTISHRLDEIRSHPDCFPCVSVHLDSAARWTAPTGCCPFEGPKKQAIETFFRRWQPHLRQAKMGFPSSCAVKPISLYPS